MKITSYKEWVCQTCPRVGLESRINGYTPNVSMDSWMDLKRIFNNLVSTGLGEYKRDSRSAMLLDLP